MIHKPWHMGVVIPARNEELLLPRCLESIFTAARRLPTDVTVDVVVAVDSSTDATFATASCMLQGYGVAVSTQAGTAGSARAAAACTLLKRYRGPLDRCWLANTDADTFVPPAWLTLQLDLAANGCEAIAGAVDVDSFEEHDAGVVQRFRTSYLIYPDGSHPHVHGANLGVRADAYLRAGGWGEQSTAEDHDLWHRLRTSGAECRSTAGLRVFTSGRRVGRAPFGFADALAAHNTVAQ